MSDARPRVSIVLPVLDDSGRVGATISRLRAELSALAPIEIVVVDDGSSDDTASAARAAGADLVVGHDVNRGKGAAVSTGMLAASGTVRAFTDVDLSYSPDQLARLVAEIECGAEMAVGSRMHPEAVAEVDATRLRRLTSRLFNVATLILHGMYRDTQCGLKAFSAQTAERLFGSTTVAGFAFDVELFLLARRWGIGVVDVPVTLSSSDISTVRLGGELRAVMDLVRLRLRRRPGSPPH